ncbi:MAG: glycosyltransferase [Tissierellaceae bacterium]|nr:glycosyltransferase [Tissierellaceae bacterium]
MRLAIFTLGTRGDVQPYIALAKKAIEKGHSAVICTGKSFKNLIEENGVEFAETKSDLMAMLETEEGKMVYNSAMRHPLKTKRYLNEVVNPAYRKSLDQFYKCAQGADVIIYHPKVFGAPDIAKALRIPCISMPPIPITYPIEEFPNLAISPTRNLGKTFNKLTYKIMYKAESASIKEVNDFREKTLNLPKRKSGKYTFKIDDNQIPIIYPISPYLFQDVKSWEDKVYLPGFFYLDTGNEVLEQKVVEFLKSGKEPIVISFSSMPLKSAGKFQEILVKALKETGNCAIVLVGNSGIDFKEENNILTVKSAPHTLLFPLAKGIIHHGGVGTVAAALKSGKAQIIIPFAVDQPFWANRLYKLGYSLKPLRESSVTTEELISVFKELDKPEIKQKAQEIKNTLSKENGTDNAINYIEHYCNRFNNNRD